MNSQTPNKYQYKLLKEYFDMCIFSSHLESKYSKKQLLNIYLQETYFGNEIKGVNEAATKIFNKNPQDLTLSESVILITMQKAPTHYSSYDTDENCIENIKVRSQYILLQMFEKNMINKEEYKSAENDLKNALSHKNINSSVGVAWSI
jgi:membrane peptidoglycan carboxypeptidase